MTNKAMEHLGNVLTILQDLHPGQKSKAFDGALEYYNACNQDCMIGPHMGTTHLVNVFHADIIVVDWNSQDHAYSVVIDGKTYYRKYSDDFKDSQKVGF